MLCSVGLVGFVSVAIHPGENFSGLLGPGMTLHYTQHCCASPEAATQTQLKGNECKINEKVSY